MAANHQPSDALNEYLREVEEYLSCHGDQKAEALRVEARGWRVTLAAPPPTTQNAANGGSKVPEGWPTDPKKYPPKGPSL